MSELCRLCALLIPHSHCPRRARAETNRKCPKYWELQIAPKAEAAAAASVSGLPLGIGIDTGL